MNEPVPFRIAQIRRAEIVEIRLFSQTTDWVSEYALVAIVDIDDL